MLDFNCYVLVSIIIKRDSRLTLVLTTGNFFLTLAGYAYTNSQIEFFQEMNKFFDKSVKNMC